METDVNTIKWEWVYSGKMETIEDILLAISQLQIVERDANKIVSVLRNRMLEIMIKE